MLDIEFRQQRFGLSARLSVENHGHRSLDRQQTHDGLSDAARTTGHEDDFSLQFEIHVRSIDSSRRILARALGTVQRHESVPLALLSSYEWKSALTFKVIQIINHA